MHFTESKTDAIIPKMRKRDIMNKEHRNWYWLALKTAWSEWTVDNASQVANHQANLERFYDMCEHKWGFVVENTEHGFSGISSNYRIINEPKFTLFKLKYSNV